MTQRKTTAKPKVKSLSNPKDKVVPLSNKIIEYMIVSDDDCQTAYNDYTEEVERQMKDIMSNPALTQSVRVFELITTAHPKITIDYD